MIDALIALAVGALAQDADDVISYVCSSTGGASIDVERTPHVGQHMNPDGAIFVFRPLRDGEASELVAAFAGDPSQYTFGMFYIGQDEALLPCENFPNRISCGDLAFSATVNKIGNRFVFLNALDYLLDTEREGHNPAFAVGTCTPL